MLRDRFASRTASRRRFLTVGLLAMAGTAVAACGGTSSSPPAATSAPAAAPTTASSTTAASPTAAGATSASPTSSASGASTPQPAAATSAGTTNVAVSITYWNDMGGGVHTKSYGALLDGLHTATGVKVDEQVMDINAMYSKLQIGSAVGQVPDCALLLTPAISHFATLGMINPIEPATLDANGVKEADYPKSVWDGQTFQGKHYAVTQDYVRDILYLNDKMFQDAGLTDSAGKPKAPTTKDELIATAQKLTKNGAFGFCVGGGDSYPAFESFFWQNGTNFFTSDLSKSDLASPAAIEVGDWWGSLLNQLKVSPPDGTDGVKGFSAGKIGMLMDGTWDANGFNDAKVAFTPAQVPTIFKQGLVWSIGHEFTFPKQKTPDDAKVQGVWKLIRWMIDNGATWTLEGGVLAVNQKNLQDSRVASDPVLKVFLANSENWRVGQPTSKWTDAEAKVEPLMDAIYTGKQSATVALTEAAKQLDALSG